MPRHHLRGFIAALALAVTNASHAHFVWIYANVQGSELRIKAGFGEPGEIEAEYAGKMKQTKYWLARTDKRIEPIVPVLDAAAGEYRCETKASGVSAVYGECVYGSFQRGDGPVGKLCYSAKHVVLAGPGWKDPGPFEKARIEILAEFSKDAAVLQVVSAGKPVPAVDLKWFGPKESKGVVKTDAQGKAVLAKIQPGVYSCFVGKATNEQGEVDGKKYTVARDYATLTFEPSAKPAMKLADKPSAQTTAGMTLLKFTTPAAALPEAFSSFGAAVLGDFAYVYGGHIAKTHSYSTQSSTGKFRRLRVKPLADQWEELSAGPPLQGLAIVAHAGRIYRLGGMKSVNPPGTATDNQSVAECAVYNPVDKQWSAAPAFPVPRSSFDAVVCNGKIYVLGGWTMKGAGHANEFCEHGLMLDPEHLSRGWTPVEQPFRRRALNAAVSGSKIFVVGGLDEDGAIDPSVNVFDAATGGWAQAEALPAPKRNGFGPAACGPHDSSGGPIVVSTGDGVVRVLETSSGTWRDVAKLAHKRIVHRILPLEGDRCLVLGGAGGGQNIAASEIVAFATTP